MPTTQIEGLAKLLRRFGFKVSTSGINTLVLTDETEKNLNYLRKVLRHAGFQADVDMEAKTATLVTRAVTERELASACRESSAQSESGLECMDELALFEPYIGSLVRFFNELGIATYESCEGHALGDLRNTFPVDEQVWPYVIFDTNRGLESIQRMLREFGDPNLTFRLRGNQTLEFSPRPAPPCDDLETNRDRLFIVQSLIANTAERLWKHKSACRSLLSF